MKLALLGDIHGNADALHAVLEAARGLGVEHLLVTGDLVGYYFAPARVLELLAPWRHHVVRGNHEDMLAEARADSQAAEAIRKRYGPGIDVALAQLSSEQVEQLCTLPHPLMLDMDGCRILLCHGAPWDVDQYVYPDAAAELVERCGQQAADFVVLGHTHYPMLKALGGTKVVNPGSVGQQRNRQPGAHWALLDTATRELTFRVEPYDTAPLAQQCRQRYPQMPYLADVLERTS